MMHNALTPQYYFFLKNWCENGPCEGWNSYVVFSLFPQAFEAAALILTFCLRQHRLYILFWNVGIFRIWTWATSSLTLLVCLPLFLRLPVSQEIRSRPLHLTLGKLICFLGIAQLTFTPPGSLTQSFSLPPSLSNSRLPSASVLVCPPSCSVCLLTLSLFLIS